LYVLPKSYGWTFLAWKSLPKEEGPSHYVVLELQEKTISSNPAKKWWSEQRYNVRVNPWNGNIEAVNSAR
jgi:hypothetical protein